MVYAGAWHEFRFRSILDAASSVSTSYLLCHVYIINIVCAYFYLFFQLFSKYEQVDDSS